MYTVMATRYSVKKHKGVRTRGLVSVTLSPDELRLLDAWAKEEHLTRSRAVAALVLRSCRLGEFTNVKAQKAG